MVTGRYPKVAVIILSWNRCMEVLKTLCWVTNEDYPGIEVILVDNSSTDGTQVIVPQLFPDVRIISLPQNIGIKGWDVGIESTDAEYIVCLDDDCHPFPGTISRVVEVFEKKQTVAIVPFNIKGGIFTTESWEHVSRDELVGYVNCAVGLRRTAVVNAGLNDPDFFLYGNEWDLTIRVLNEGYEIAFDPSIKAHHRASVLNRSHKRLRTLTARNEAWIVLKYFRWNKIPIMIFRVWFWNTTTVLSEGLTSAYYTARGVIVDLLNWKLAWKKRKPIRQDILMRFERNFWSFRPVLPALRNFLKNFG
jgi:GT2 family glycosyltransferase